jgi:hypothetical protein
MQRKPYPYFDRISVLTATILLAYVVARYIDLPERSIEVDVFGFLLTAQFNVNTLVAILVAGLSATGADWLIRGHPARRGAQTLSHWVLPGLTAWTLGLTLNLLPVSGLLWWVVLAIGAGLLIMVLVAEYTVVDPVSEQFNIAALGLTVLSFALYLVLVTNLKAQDVRLVFLLPAAFFTTVLISMRTIYLRLFRQGLAMVDNVTTALLAAIVIGIVVAQFVGALHYAPISPVGFGLILLGPAYALTNLISSLTEGVQMQRVWVEPAILCVAIWGLAIWFR